VTGRIGLLARRELRAHLVMPATYVGVAAFVLLNGISFCSYLADNDYSDTSIKGFCDSSQFLVLLLAALLTMRSLAEERSSGTWELLFTSPIRDFEVVLAKYLASLCVLTVALLLTTFFPVLLFTFGDPDFGPIVTSYSGIFLLGAAAVAVGIFSSSLAANQALAALLSGVISFGLWFLGSFTGAFSESIGTLLYRISLQRHFDDFVRGIIDTRAILHYFSVLAIFLFLATRSIESGRYR
jgi:ABC-2 type transport system permease protein